MTRSLKDIKSGDDLLYALGFTNCGHKILAERNGWIVEYIKDGYGTVVEYGNLISNPYDYNELEEDIFNMEYPDIKEKYPQIDIIEYDDIGQWAVETLDLPYVGF